MKYDFLNLLFRLAQANVDFVVVGGFAAIVHGCTLVTQDIDVCCDFGAENLLRLQSAVADLHPVHRMTPNRLALTLTPETARHYNTLYLDTDAGQLDCISEVKGIGGFEQVLRNSVRLEIEDQKFWVLDVDSLIQAKTAMNRPHDREAVNQLETLKRLGGKQK